MTLLKRDFITFVKKNYRLNIQNMAVTKNALVRYQVLDKCFRNPGRNYTLDDLLEECNKALYELNGDTDGIKRRQLQKDIVFMESDQGWAIPLERIRFGEKNQKVYFRYEDSSFSINNQPLNQSEAEQLKAALLMLSRFTGAPQFEWIQEIIPIIEDKLGLVGNGEKVIAYDQNVDAAGLQHIQAFFNAITNKVVLQVTYKDFTAPDPYQLLFHPYYLKQYNNRWFVFGHKEGTDRTDWNLALDRVVDTSMTKVTYSMCETDWEEYFYDIVGVTKPNEGIVEKILLKFSHEQAPYIITKPLHPSQRIKNCETGMEVRVALIINFEFERLLLSFGERVEVIEPPHLRNKIAGILQTAAEHYS